MSNSTPSDEGYDAWKHRLTNTRKDMQDFYRNEKHVREPSAEEQLRKDNPGLQELWDQYQTMLKLLTPATAPAKKEESQSSAAKMMAALKAKRLKNHAPGMHIEADMGTGGTIKVNGNKTTMHDLKKFFNGDSE